MWAVARPTMLGHVPHAVQPPCKMVTNNFFSSMPAKAWLYNFNGYFHPKGAHLCNYGNKFIFGSFCLIMPKFALNWGILEHVTRSPCEPFHMLFQKPYNFGYFHRAYAIRQVIASTFGLY